MRRIKSATIGSVFTLAWLLAGSPALAQFIPPPPELENRIPKPLPPPPQPPIINGGPQGQGPAPGVIRQPRINSAGERASRCMHDGAGYGLRGGDLAAYARSCANN